MFFNIQELKTKYEIYGISPQRVLLLHGWGANMKIFNELRHALLFDYTLISLDLPGFGFTERPKTVWSAEDYADFVLAFMKRLNMDDDTVVLGHSFGGKVAAILATKRKIKKLVLVHSSGIVAKKSLWSKFKIKLAKTAKVILVKFFGIKEDGKLMSILKRKLGSNDYKNATTIMQKILVNTVNNDISDVFANIKVPTLIFGGKKDKQTPPYVSERIHELVEGSELIMLDTEHFSFLDMKNEFIKHLTKFIDN